MTTQVLAGKKGVAAISVERESLSLLASRIFVAMATLVAAAFCLDFVGGPDSHQTKMFVFGAMTASVMEPAVSIAYQRFLNNRAVRFFYMSAKAVGSLNAGAVVSLLALMFGDVAFQGVSAAVAAICGVVAGGVAASRVSMPDNGPRVVGVAASADEDAALNQEDRYLAAVHEAGHALALSFIDAEYRAGAFVQIGGSKTTFTNVPDIASMWSVAPYRKAQMLALLAGPVATDLHFGASAEGGRQDLIEWRHKAMSVLTAERVKGWNPQPMDEMSYEQNEHLIADIEEAQSEALTEFFTLNGELYYELVDFLFENGGASEEELEGFLQRAQTSELIREAIG